MTWKIGEIYQICLRFWKHISFFGQDHYPAVVWFLLNISNISNISNKLVCMYV